MRKVNMSGVRQRAIMPTSISEALQRAATQLLFKNLIDIGRTFDIHIRVTEAQFLECLGVMKQQQRLFQSETILAHKPFDNLGGDILDKKLKCITDRCHSTLR